MNFGLSLPNHGNYGHIHRILELAYVRRHIAHQPSTVLYDDTGESWFDFAAIHLPFEPEMWLVPLFGHTRGHYGVVIRSEAGWLFHVGDAAPMDFTQNVPAWLVRFLLGGHTPRLREFRKNTLRFK